MPTGKPGASDYGLLQSVEFFASDYVHGVGLLDQIDRAHVFGVGVNRRRFLDSHIEAVGLEIGDKYVGGLDWLVAIPATSYYECVLHSWILAYVGC